MNRNIASLISAILVASMPVLVVVSTVQADSGCSVATLEGTFGVINIWFTQGTGAATAAFATRPAAQLTLISFDGAGSWSQGLSTQSNNGAIFSFSTRGGTYTVDSNCIATVTSSTPPIQTIKLVIAAKGKQLQLLLIPTPNPFFPGWVPTGAVVIRIGKQTCSVATIKGNYGFSITGFSQGTGATIATVASLPSSSGGIITVDGAGGFSFSGAQSINGVISSFSGAGTYTVNPDCTGSSIDTSGGTSNFVIGAKGDEVLVISTVSGQVVTGVLRKIDD